MFAQLGLFKPCDQIHLGGLSVPLVRNASDPWAGLEREVVNADPPENGSGGTGWGGNLQDHRFGLPGQWGRRVGKVSQGNVGGPVGLRVVSPNAE